MTGIKGVQKGIGFTRFALENPDRVHGGVQRISRDGKIKRIYSEKAPHSIPLPQGVRAELARA